jgi:hypothetical protein
MFLEKSAHSENSDQESATRWGDGNVQYKSVSFTVQGQGEQQKLVIAAEAVANENVDSPNFGFLVRNGGGTAVLGTNSHIKRQFLDHMKKGEHITITWEFDNILNDGTYFVEPAIVYGGTQTADWWEEAAWVEIRKEEQTSYPVNPPIKLQLQVAGKAPVKPGKERSND